jgi:hypothetical protein
MRRLIVWLLLKHAYRVAKNDKFKAMEVCRLIGHKYPNQTRRPKMCERPPEIRCLFCSKKKAAKRQAVTHNIKLRYRRDGEDLWIDFECILCGRVWSPVELEHERHTEHVIDISGNFADGFQSAAFDRLEQAVKEIDAERLAAEGATG